MKTLRRPTRSLHQPAMVMATRVVTMPARLRGTIVAFASATGRRR